MHIIRECMTIETEHGDYVFLMNNSNNIELDAKLMRKMEKSKLGYRLSKDYLMTRREYLKRAIKELKAWHYI